MNLNKRRQILRALEQKKKNPLLFLPCIIAIIAVKAFYAVCMNADMALSDEEGNFLGIKSREKKAAHDFDKEMEKLAEAAAKDKDDFTDKEKKRLSEELPYRPMWMRLTSATLAAAFAFMILPAAEVAAMGEATGSSDLVFTWDEDGIKEFPPTKSLQNTVSVDLFSFYSDPDAVPLKVASGVFKNMPSLTKITLGYSDTFDKKSIASGNFTNIAPDYTFYIKADNETDYNTMADRLSSIVKKNTASNLNINPYPIVWDVGGAASAEADKLNVSNLRAYSGVGKIIFEWDENNKADGYILYKKVTGTSTAGASFTYQRISEFANEELDIEGGVCRLELDGTSEAVYAIRAYENYDLGYTPDPYKLTSPKFAVSDKVVSKTAGKPEMEDVSSNENIAIEISMPSDVSDPSYIVVFRKSGTTTEIVDRYEPVTGMSHTYIDPEPFSNSENKRDYYAAAYYDAMYVKGSLIPDVEFPSKDKSETDLTIRKAAITVNNVKINPPQDLIVREPEADIDLDDRWELSWKAPLDITDEMEVKYKVYINHVLYTTIEPDDSVFDVTKDIKLTVPADLTKLPSEIAASFGEDIIFGVQAFSTKLEDRISPSIIKEVNIDVKNNCVDLRNASAGNAKVTLTFTDPFAAATKVYDIYYITESDSGTVDKHLTLEPKDITKNSDGTMSVIIGDGGFGVLENNRTYRFFITTDTSKYRSAEKTATPIDSPPAPSQITPVVREYGADIHWTAAYQANGQIVDGYYLTIEEVVGDTRTKIIDHLRLDGGSNTKYSVDNLKNDCTYEAVITSFVQVGTDLPIETNYDARAVQQFVPTVTVKNALDVTAVVEKETSIKITWKPVADATSYILYRSDPINGKDKGINVSKNTSYVDSTVKNKVMYTYSVVAVRVVDDKPYYSEESTANPVQIAVYVDPVGNLKATGSDGAITLTWDPANKADGYIIRYTTPYGSGFEDLDRIKSSPFVHSGLLNKTSYKYSVTAYRIVNGEMIESEHNALPVVGTAGTPLAAPADFKVVPGDGENTLSWSKVNGADGYAVYVVDSSGSGYRLIDRVSKTTAIHTNIPNGTTVTYRVCAFKMVNGQTEEGDFTNNITVTTGVYLGSPTDVVATAGDASVTIKWKKVDGAEGYVVYSYEGNSTSFTPVGIVTSPSFTHTGLTNGRTYTYMICAYKTIEGKPQYSGYSLSVSAIPMGKDTENSNNKPEEPAEYRIYITGTTPYGMSNSNLISAFANKGAITNDVDVRFTLNGEDVEAIQRVLNYYGEGVESFMIYPMNISLYKSGTDEKIQLENGYTMTLTIPVPDELLHVSEYITVIHVSENDQLEILPSTHVSVNGVDCMQFTAASFSPFAFVVYLSQITDDSIFGEGEDVSTGAFASADGSVEIQVSQTAVLRCTYLPQIYRRRARNKVYRVIKHKR